MRWSGAARERQSSQIQDVRPATDGTTWSVHPGRWAGRPASGTAAHSYCTFLGRIARPASVSRARPRVHPLKVWSCTKYVETFWSLAFSESRRKCCLPAGRGTHRGSGWSRSFPGIPCWYAAWSAEWRWFHAHRRLQSPGLPAASRGFHRLAAKGSCSGEPPDAERGPPWSEGPPAWCARPRWRVPPR